MKPSRTVSADEAAVLRAALPAYDVLDVIGRGAFAVVYLAEHRGLGRKVAIKRLSQELVRDTDVRRRFAAEARVLASLDHPHIVRVYDYAETEALCALVMEYLTGGTLATRTRVERPPPAAACAIALAVLNGLEHAHQHGVLHRDIKPENLLFGAGDLVKVADFGIAKVIGAHGADPTATGMLGTPAYMAPEQITRSGELSCTTDIWAVGAVLYEMLTGRPTHARDADTSVAELLFARTHEDARDIRDVASHLPEQLCRVVMRALQRAPEDRYPTAAQFADAVERTALQVLGPASLAATGIPIHRTQPRPDGSLTTVTTSARLDPAASSRSRPRWLGARPRLRVVASAVAAVTLGVGLLSDDAPSHSLAAPPEPLPLAGDVPSNPLAGLPEPLPGWPAHMALGYHDPVAGPTGVALRTGPGGIATTVYGEGDAAAGKDWSHDHTSPSPYQFAADAQRHGLLPYLDYYVLRTLGRNGSRSNANDAQTIRRILNNRTLMRVYWDNVRLFLKQLGATHRPVTVSIDPGMWALIEAQLSQSSESPADVPVIVAAAGLPELTALSDTFSSFAAAWNALRDRYAPDVLLGVPFDFYGAAAGTDLRRSVPSTSALSSLAKSQADYFLTTAVNQVDFVSFEVNWSEEGHNTTPQQNYSPSEKAALLAWLRQFQASSHIPVVLESVPLGNTVMRTIDDKPYHWHDTWVQWLIGDPPFTHLRDLRAAGVIGIVFGVAAGADETCACDAADDGITNGGQSGLVSHSADDDGGYLAARLAALHDAGGLDLPRPS
jgi:serine/threonine protein kinase